MRPGEFDEGDGYDKKCKNWMIWLILMEHIVISFAN